MPRANSSGRSGGRRNSRSESSGNRTPRSSKGSDRGKPREDGSARGNRSSGPPRSERPYKKSDKPFERRSRGSSDSSGAYGASRPKGKGKQRPFEKDNKPFAKRRGRDEAGPSESSGSYGASRPKGKGSSRSFEKNDKSFAKRKGRDEERSSESSGSYGASRPKGKGSSRPFEKNEKPYGQRGRGENNRSDRKSGQFSKRSSGQSGSSSSRSSGGRLDKPFSKFEKPRGSRGGDGESSQRSFSGKRKFPEDKKGFASKRKTSSDRFSRGTQDTEAPVQTEKIRLNRYIANSGVCSRREADELITMGVISVNGKTITELGYKVNPGDEVRYENKILRAEKPVYILLNKPKGYLTTTEDPQERNTVMHIIGNAVKERIYPVGRLDRNTTGLLLLTNDGDLADKLMHPSYNVKKIYKVELDRPLSKADFQTILDGVRLEEGKAIVDDLAILDDGKTVGIELHIGWNRVVRRIFESLNYEVVKLDRSVYAGLDKKDLSRGHWRYLTNEEIIRLKHYK